MRQSASMAEIATEDGTKEEEEEETVSTEGVDKEEKQGEEREEREKTGDEEQVDNHSGVSCVTNIESDSDTEDEEEEVTSSYTCPSQAAPKTQTGAAQPCLSASQTSSPQTKESTAAGPSVLSGITVTEAKAPPGNPPSPGRCISVSSPGRGHKIFMVTRVESPPEQKQQQQQPLLHFTAQAAPSHSKEALEKPVDADTRPNAQQMQPTPASPTPTPLLTQTEDCKLTEQSPVANPDSVPNTTLSQTLEPEASQQARENVRAFSLEPNLQAPALPLGSSAEQAVASLLNENAQSQQTQSSGVELEKCREEKDGATEEGQEVSPPSSAEKGDEEMCPTHVTPSEVENQQPTSSSEQHQDEEAFSSPEEKLSLRRQEEEAVEEELPRQETTDSSSHTRTLTTTQQEDNQTTHEEPSPQQQAEADDQKVDSGLLIMSDQNTPSAAVDADPVENLESTETRVVSQVEVEDSPDESSADEMESFADTLDGEVVGPLLPNGLKTEFSLHLLDAENPKPGSCVMEHGELYIFCCFFFFGGGGFHDEYMFINLIFLSQCCDVVFHNFHAC